MTAEGLYSLLRDRYCGQNWALIAQVPDGTGAHKGRTADALAMSLWPSQGLDLHGFEIKVARSDWTREIQDPTKAAAFSRYCDYWWIVAPQGVVKLEEMPGSWGLLCPTKAATGLRVAKGPDRNPNPEVIDRAFLAGLFRGVHKNAPTEAALDAEYQRGRSEAAQERTRRRNAERESQRKSDIRELNDLRYAVEQFEEASGLQIREWGRGRRLGELISKVDESQLPNCLRQLQEMAAYFERNHQRFTAAAEIVGAAIGKNGDAR